ncbi:alaserpin-like [Zophobas morio]|uniref:alaserpin-like n=1 Tax=Zophobas morio TaxID=2755281 RepID=UPI0030836CEF
MKTSLIILSFIGIVLANDEDDFTKANNKFASTVYSEIAKNKKENFLVSPFSAETILALTHAGAKGPTAQELQNAIHLPGDNKKIEEGAKTLLPSLQTHDPYTLKTANKMYIKNNFEIKPDFKQVATEAFFADSESIDFVENVKAAETMNTWVEKQTENRIQNLISPDVVNNETRLVLINALYFKANWSSRFHLSYTKKIDFYKSAADVVKVDAMTNKHGQRFLFFDCHHLNAKFLELPFKGEEASMTFILPNDKDGLPRLESDLERALVPHNLTRERLTVQLPKFKIESKIDLKKMLKNLGVVTVFTDFQADLSGIAGEPGDLVVNEVVQKSFIDVNEEGVEAAAATFALVAVPMMGFSNKPKEFLADHPFIFYIRVKGVIIFVGRVIDPSN